MRFFCAFQDSKEKAASSMETVQWHDCPTDSLAILLALASLPGRSMSLPSLLHVYEHGLADGGLSDFPAMKVGEEAQGL